MPDDLVIASARLDLVSLGPDILEALLDGSTEEAEQLVGAPIPESWLGDDPPPLTWRLHQIRQDPTTQPWLLRAVVQREPRAVAGYFNFHGPPTDENWVEMGYDIEPGFRRKGYATEVALRMMQWARDEHAVTKFRASISPENAPSLAMIEKLGFHKIGTQMDEIDGLEIVFEREGVPTV